MANRLANLQQQIQPPNSIIYEERLAANMMQLCVDSYKIGKNTAQNPTFYPGFKFIKTIYDQQSQKSALVLAFVGIDQKRKAIILSIRGTQNIFNKADDASLNNGISRVHEGFKDTYDVFLQENLVQAMDDMVKQYPTYSVIYTGHSLGGAIAQLAAVHHKDRSLNKQLRVQVYTCGQPRVGNEAVVALVDKLVPQNFRVINIKDRVPHVPKNVLFYDYKHAGYEIWYKDGTKNRYGVFKSESNKGSLSTSIFTRQIDNHSSAEYNMMQDKTEFRDANMSMAIN